MAAVALGTGAVRGIEAARGVVMRRGIALTALGIVLTVPGTAVALGTGAVRGIEAARGVAMRRGIALTAHGIVLTVPGTAVAGVAVASAHSTGRFPHPPYQALSPGRDRIGVAMATIFELPTPSRKIWPENSTGTSQHEVESVTSRYAQSFAIVGTIITLVGCSATGPAFKELTTVPRDQVIVYVYRPSSFTNSGNAPNLFVNDVDHGQLWNAGYIPLTLPPGKVSLVLKGEQWKWGLPPIGTNSQLEAGKIYYFRMGNRIDLADYTGAAKGPSSTSNLSPVLGRTIDIQQVPTDYGRHEIVATKLAGQDGR
jgi:hypothetical protein